MKITMLNPDGVIVCVMDTDILGECSVTIARDDMVVRAREVFDGRSITAPTKAAVR